MKLPPAQLAGFLKSPPAGTDAILLHGPDDGLIKERAGQILAGILGPDLDDPFRLTHLAAEDLRQDPARLADEAAALGLFGGRRVVRLRDAGDAVSAPLAGILNGPPSAALLVIESGDLGKSSSLRRLCEDHARAVAVACYADGPREIATLIRETMAAHRIALDDKVAAYLVENLGGDRLVTRAEIEKLILYAGDGGRLELDEVLALVGDTSALALDDLVYDAFDGRGAGLDAALARLLLDGQAPVSVLRALMRHAQRLHFCAAARSGGEGVETAIRALRPPVFFKYTDRFRRQVEGWPADRLARLLPLLTRAEIQFKQTGSPDELLCRQLLTMIARGSGRRSA